MLIYLAQLSHELNGSYQNRCLPLAIGYLGGYLVQNLGKSSEVQLFKSPAELNEALVTRTPHILLLSNYLWNEKLTLFYGEKARELDPAMLIVMGGPNLSTNAGDARAFLEQNPFLDKLVYFEGEKIIFSLVRDFLEHRDRSKTVLTPYHNTMALAGDVLIEGEFSNKNKAVIPGVFTGTGSKLLDEIPSPYLLGLMDKFFRDLEVPMLETSRGCPFRCSYCQQGNQEYKKIRFFSHGRIREEMDWISRIIREKNLNIDSLSITDPNLAMYNRDRETLGIIKEFQEAWGYPANIICSTGKNRPGTILEGTIQLEKGSILYRSALQSLHTDTLAAINRSNIKVETFYQIQDKLKEEKLENCTDLMLGLPEETEHSHYEGIFKTIDIGVNELACLQTIALKGTKLRNREYVARHGIETKKRIIQGAYGTYKALRDDRFVIENDDVIVSTTHMSFAEYQSCRKLHLIVMIFHNTRLLNYIYDLFDLLALKRSRIIREICRTRHGQFNALINAFLKETEGELFDDYQELNKGLDIKDITSNKLVKYVQKFIAGHQDVLTEVLEEVLRSILKDDCRADVGELVGVFQMAMDLIAREAGQTGEYAFNSPGLRENLGHRLRVEINKRYSLSFGRIYPLVEYIPYNR